MHPALYSCPWYNSTPLLPMYDYPSPVPSDPPPQQPDQNSSAFDQIDSSIGPTRVTRRQASLKQGLLVRRVSLSTNYISPDDVPSPSVCPC